MSGYMANRSKTGTKRATTRALLVLCSWRKILLAIVRNSSRRARRGKTADMRGGGAPDSAR